MQWGVGGLGVGQAATASRCARAGAVVSSPVAVHWLLLTGAEFADDAVIVDADVIVGVGLHGGGLVGVMTA